MKSETKKTIHDIQQHEKYPFSILQLGDQVNIRYYTDVEPATVMKVSPNGKRVELRVDQYKLKEGQKPEFSAGGFAAHCSNQSDLQYDCSEDPDGKIIKASLRLWRGRYCWTLKGSDPDGTQHVNKGWRAFYDYNF